MDIAIGKLDKKDYPKVIAFAKAGMHFDRYTDVRWELNVYGRYFLYLELERATQVLAAYMGDQLVGILMADMRGEPKACHSPWRALFVRAIKAVMKLAFQGGADAYGQANAQMLRDYKQAANPDGEICFLAADPNIMGKGIGSLLLDELAAREPGKTIYLYTDSNCTYQFYEHRGFARMAQRDIEMNLHNKKAPLTCFLYSKTL